MSWWLAWSWLASLGSGAQFRFDHVFSQLTLHGGKKLSSPIPWLLQHPGSMEVLFCDRSPVTLLVNDSVFLWTWEASWTQTHIPVMGGGVAPALYGRGQSILGLQWQSSHPARQILRTTVDGRPGHLKRQWGKERKNILSETRARGNRDRSENMHECKS